MNDWATTMTALLGNRVEVTLSTQPDMKVVGVLEDFDTLGRVSVWADTGELHQAWPNLHIRELS